MAWAPSAAGGSPDAQRVAGAQGALVSMRLIGATLAALTVGAGLGPAAAGQRAQAKLPWWDRAAEAHVGHYWIKTDLPTDEANELARHINIMHVEYAKRLASLPPRAPVDLKVLIFEDRDDYVRTLRTRFGVDASGTGGIFVTHPSGSGLAFWTGRQPRRRVHHVAQHEGFHQFAHSRFAGDLPVWVNEGLAEFFGESVIVGAKLVIGQTNPRVLNTIKAAIEIDKHIPFRRMLTMTHEQWKLAVRERTASFQYDQAWSMVHFLVYGDDGKYVSAFERYLRLLNTGMPPDAAFTRVFGDDIDAFEERWKAYALAAKPSAFVTALERIEFLAEGVRELARRGIYPESLDELREALRSIVFDYVLPKHEVAITLSADDSAMFLIPKDDLTEEQPVFVVEAPDRVRMGRRQRFLEQSNPTPPSIATEHLAPKGLSVRWVRSQDNTEFRYEIVVE